MAGEGLTNASWVLRQVGFSVLVLAFIAFIKVKRGFEPGYFVEMEREIIFSMNYVTVSSIPFFSSHP